MAGPHPRGVTTQCTDAPGRLQIGMRSRLSWCALAVLAVLSLSLPLFADAATPPNPHAMATFECAGKRLTSGGWVLSPPPAPPETTYGNAELTHAAPHCRPASCPPSLPGPQNPIP